LLNITFYGILLFMSTGESPLSQPNAAVVREPFPAIEEGYLPDNVLVHFHFAPHIYGYHFEGAQQLLEAADAYIPEARGWDHGVLKEFNDLAKRKIELSKYLGHGRRDSGYSEAQSRAIEGTRKPIVFIDGSLQELGPSELSVGLASPDETLEDTIDKISEVAKRTALESVRRDPIMIGNLGDKVWTLYKKNRDWVEREQINILCTLGQSHIAVYDYLSQQEGSRENVAASMWVGGNDITETYKVMDYFKRGEVPPRRLLVESVVMELLGLPQTQHFLEQAITVNVSPRHGQGLTEVESFSQRLVDLIADDIDDSPRLQKSMQSFLNGDIRPGYIALLRQYVERAKEASTTP